MQNALEKQLFGMSSAPAFYWCQTWIFQVAEVAGDRPKVLGGIPGWMGALKARAGGHGSCPHTPRGFSGWSSRQRSRTGRKGKSAFIYLLKGWQGKKVFYVAACILLFKCICENGQQFISFDFMVELLREKHQMSATKTNFQWLSPPQKYLKNTV